MDRHRGDRSGGDGGGGGRHSRMQSRWSDGPVDPQQQQQSYRQPFGHSRGGGGHGGFSEGRHHPYRGGPHEYQSGGGGRSPGFRAGPGGYGGFGDQQMPMGGPRRGGGAGGGGFFGAGRGELPNSSDGSKFAKLFIGSVPRTATEEDIRPLFEEHGHVVEVALIKDKRTGQQQGCCFIKYANSEDADRAIRFLHNQYTLPGGMGPIQVRYADGERERLGAVEHKLFVGSLNKQATEKEIEEIFSSYGRVEDVYIMRDDMKQSRGCGFVKFSNREMAAAAINALNGVFVMRGCEQPLIVRFADPKRPRPGESRGGPTFGGPGFGPRSQAPPMGRSTPNIDEPMGGRLPPNSWHQMSPESLAPAPHGFSSHLHSKGGVLATSTTGFSPSVHAPPIGQQISPLQKSTLSPQRLPPSLQLHHNQQTSAPYLQNQTMQAPGQQLAPIQIPQSGGLPTFTQSLPSQQFIGLGGQLSSSQPLLHQGVSATSLQLPLNIPQSGPAGINQQQLPGSAVSQLLQQPIQQSQAQMLLQQQQAQNLQSNFQSSQQTFSQLQHQLQLMQPSNLSQQQSSLPMKQQVLQSVSSALAGTASAVLPTSSSSPSLQLGNQTATPLTCNWTEHISPEGFKYYYNSVTQESKWEKPEELAVFEQQQKLQQQQKLAIQQLQSSQMQAQVQAQTQAQAQIQSSRQVSQMQQVQAQMQLRQQAQLQQIQPSISYQASSALSNQNIQDLGYSQLQGVNSSIDSGRAQKYMQGSQSAQDWMWKNKSTGT